MKHNLTLLYVEDDEIVRENFTEIFETYFDKVLTTDNGNEALKLYKNNDIDVAILDISIPGINGLSVASKIREHDTETILLIISAHSDSDKLLKAVNLGLVGYLVKPVTHQALNESIQRILKTISKESFLTLSNNYIWSPTQAILFYNDFEIKLTKNEIKIVEALIGNRNKYLTARDIEDELYGQKATSNTNCNNIVQLISRLKKKTLETCKTDEFFIENCYGAGYKIVISS